MKCPKCGGEGKYLKMEQGNSCYEVGLSFCDMCHGSGEVEMTNEEYLKQASTEELANELHEHFLWGMTVNAEECMTEEYTNRIKKHIMEWLKQPYRGKNEN